MSMRMGWLLLLAVLVGPSLMLLTPQSVDAQPAVFRTVTVNCGAPGQTIANALRRQVVGGGLLVLISGTCNEHVDIFRDDVILRGNPTATINGPTTTDDTVGLDHVRRVTLESLTITGGRNGIAVFGSSVTLSHVTVQGASVIGITVSYGGHAFIDASLVRQNGSAGISAANTSTAVVTNTTVELNASTGMQAVRASHLRVGQDFQGGSTVGPVIVRNNTGTGISINDSSAGIIIGSTIQGNQSNGMYVARGSHADIGIGSFNVVSANTIKDNGPNASGILVEGASANIVGNTITGNGFGVHFISGGNGRLGVRPDSDRLYREHDFDEPSGRPADDYRNSRGHRRQHHKWERHQRRGRLPLWSLHFTGCGKLHRPEHHREPPRQRDLRAPGLPVLGQWLRQSRHDRQHHPQQRMRAGGGSNRSGVFMFEGSTGEIRTTLLTNNCGSNVQVFLGNVLDVRGGNVGNPPTLVPTTISSAQVAPGGNPASTHGIAVGTRGLVRIGTGTVIDANPGDGVNLDKAGTLEIRNDVPSTISNNGTAGVTTNGFPINCTNSGTETSVAVPTSGGVPIFTGNIAGNTVNNCTASSR